LFVSVATLATFNWAGTQSTYVFNTEESENEVEFSDADTDIPTYEAVGKVVADAVSTVPEEIAELDKIGFDETVLLDESFHT
jgi:hypothetical protein